MILYLYALADAIDQVDGVPGVMGEAPVVLKTPGCALVAGWLEERPAIDRGTLTRQDALVRHVHARAHAVLPVRFGTSMADDDAAIRAVSTLERAIRDRLELVRDREQMTVRVSGASSASGASGASDVAPGRRYLERIAAQRVPLEVQPLLDAVAPLPRAVRVESGRQSGIVTVYHLIDRGGSAAYVEAATRAARDLPSLTIRISGPSPAYAFADLGRL